MIKTSKVPISRHVAEPDLETGVFKYSGFSYHYILKVSACWTK